MNPKKKPNRKPLNRPPFQSKRGYWEICRDGKKLLLHRYVYEAAYGPIPRGYHIHHIDGNKANNSLDNLECLPAHDHISRHKLGRRPSHSVLPDGTIVKQCHICRELHPLDEMVRYKTPKGHFAYRPYCKPCHSRKYGWKKYKSDH